jgi:hypothetical protein
MNAEFDMSKMYIQFKTFNDFIRFITFSPTPFVQHITIKDHNVYFVQIAGFGERVLYYVEMDEAVKEKYIVYNRFRDTVSFSDKKESDGQSVSIPILEVERTNVFTEYPPQ